MKNLEISESTKKRIEKCNHLFSSITGGSVESPYGSHKSSFSSLSNATGIINIKRPSLTLAIFSEKNEKNRSYSYAYSPWSLSNSEAIKIKNNRKLTVSDDYEEFQAPFILVRKLSKAFFNSQNPGKLGKFFLNIKVL
uniref:Uncharacterized protein n=1 Tax=Strongyloides papillosus TaxID=174720 RepID=A0A0N5C822_STREA